MSVTKLRRACALGWLLAACSAGAQTAAPAVTSAATPPKPPEAEAFAARPRLSGFVVSPDNSKAAFLLPGPKGFLSLAVLDLTKPDTIRTIKAYGDANITRVLWVNDRRLVYDAWQPGVEVRAGGAGVFAIDADGQNERQLVAWVASTDAAIGSRIKERMLPYDWFLWRTVDDGSDDVLVDRRDLQNTDAPKDRFISRLNTLTGERRSLTFGQPSAPQDWVFDQAGELRLVTSSSRGRTRLHARLPGSGNWELLQDEADDSPALLHPVYMEGQSQLLVASRQGNDTRGLYLYDLRQRKLDPEPLLAVKGFDVGGDVEVDAKAGRAVGYHMHADGPLSVWFDERLAAAQQAVDTALPGRFNQLLCGRCLSAERFVVRSSSDRIAAEYHVYDSKLRRLSALGAARPWLPEAAQGRRTFHRVAARDGLMLPVVVTHPPGRGEKEPLPTVLLVHGGPWVRGTSRAWAAEPQFLATRGWRVLEVDFRGSTGLGSRHFRAGWGQWGQAMQDDLADALDWAARERLTDASRVCIVGASYGGYAALMGPVRHPGRYRCAVSFAGVTDLALMFKSRWTDMSEDSRSFGWPQMVGDPDRDAAQLRQNSPLHRVADIKVPVMVMYGRLDQRVDKAHGSRFVEAARAAGVAVEEVKYADEAHGFSEGDNLADYLQRLERFIATAMAAPAKP